MSSGVVGKLVFIDGNMRGEMYRRSLENNLLGSVKMLSLTNEWIFQRDNDPKHHAAIVTRWLHGNKFNRINWPSFSPDLNPIERLWNETEHRMKKNESMKCDKIKRMLDEDVEVY